MHVTLCDTTCGVAKQTRNRKFGKPEVAGDAGKGMPKGSGANFGKGTYCS